MTLHTECALAPVGVSKYVAMTARRRQITLEAQPYSHCPANQVNREPLAILLHRHVVALP